MDGWRALSYLALIQAMSDCAGRHAKIDRRAKSYERSAVRWQATRWLRYSPECQEIRDTLGGPWPALTGDGLVELAKSDINWFQVSMLAWRLI